MNRQDEKRRVNRFTHERLQRQQKLHKQKLFMIVGASGSGKDYIVDKCCHDFNKSKVCSRTTRAPRYIGENTHKFVTWDEAIHDFWDAIAKTTFAGNRYYTLEEDLIGKDFYIIDPAGIYGMDKDRLKEFNCEIIFLNINWITRAKNMKSRGDSWISIIKRLIHDRRAFAQFTSYDKKFNSTEEFYDYFKVISNK